MIHTVGNSWTRIILKILSSLGYILLLNFNIFRRGIVSLMLFLSLSLSPNQPCKEGSIFNKYLFYKYALVFWKNKNISWNPYGKLSHYTDRHLKIVFKRTRQWDIPQANIFRSTVHERKINSKYMNHISQKNCRRCVNKSYEQTIYK